MNDEITISSVYNSLKFDENNVPYLSRQKIELIAELFLSKYYPSSLEKPTFVTINAIIKRLIELDKAKFIFDTYLGWIGDEKILGKTTLKDKIIYIDKDIIDKDNRFSFVVAHELGHLFLHTIKPIKDDNKERIVDVIDDKEKFFLQKRAIRSVRGWIEWQANTFAAAVLMPKKTFKNALVSIQQSLDINRNLGTVFIDKQDTNRKAFDSIANRLGIIYRTSTTASKYRLNNLDLVDDNLKKELDGLHISNLLSEFIKKSER